MYNLIQELIAHTWNNTSGSTTEQQIIYYICGAIIIIFSITVLDLLYRVFRSILKGKA